MCSDPFRHEPIISLHVPKCGGQSFGEIIKQKVSKKYRVEYYYPDVDMFLPDDWNQPGTFIHGHFEVRKGNSVEDVCPGIRNYITIIRDPYEACISGYFYGLQNNFEWATSRTLEEYIQIKTAVPEGPLSFALPRHDDVDTIEKYCEKFMLIGVLDSMPMFLAQLKKLTGVSPEEFPVLNKAERGKQDEDFRKQVEEAFPFDFELYNHVKRLGCYVRDWSGTTNP